MVRKTFQDALFEIKTKGKEAENLRLHPLKTNEEIDEYLKKINYDDADKELLHNNDTDVYVITFKNNIPVGLLALNEDEKFIYDIYIKGKYKDKGYFKETLIFCIEKKKCTNVYVNKYNKRAVIGYIAYNFLFIKYDKKNKDNYIMKYVSDTDATNQRTLYDRI
ncbi:MAG: hypothetical protein ACOCRK_05665 [bacterium]